MLPESIAIVMAPRDSSRYVLLLISRTENSGAQLLLILQITSALHIRRNHGIFRLTTPGGMGVIRHCPRRGFHAHDPPPDGGPIYKECSDVYLNPKLKFDVIDLR